MNNKTVFKKETFKKLNEYLTERVIYQIIIMNIALICIIGVFIARKSYMLCIVALVLFFVFPSFLLWFRKNRIEAVLKEGEPIYGKCFYEYGFEETKITIKYTFENKSESQELVYRQIYKVIEDKDALYILLGGKQAYIVSKDGFSSEEEKNKVIELMKKNSVKYVRKK